MNTRLRRQTLRNAPTPGEAAAWRTLRLLRHEGVHVRRQHPVGPYLLDFAVLKARLGIEIDGGVHELPGRRERDAVRDMALAGLGWRVLRLPNAIAFSPDHLVVAVRAALRR